MFDFAPLYSTPQNRVRRTIHQQPLSSCGADFLSNASAWPERCLSRHWDQRGPLCVPPSHHRARGPADVKSETAFLAHLSRSGVPVTAMRDAFVNGYREVRPMTSNDFEAALRFVVVRHFWLMGEYASRAEVKAKALALRRSNNGSSSRKRWNAKFP